MSLTLIDAGPLIAYYDAGDRWHKPIKLFLERFTGQFVTTSPCLTEALYLLRANYQVQNELLLDVSTGLYLVEELLPEDFSRIAELNSKYADVPGDFADLSLVVIAERLRLSHIVSFDGDFDVYRRYGKHLFQRVSII